MQAIVIKTLLLTIILCTPINICNAESITQEMYYITVAFDKKSVRKDDILRNFQQYTSARIIETASELAVAIGGYPRIQEASALLQSIKPEHSAARIQKTSEMTDTGKPILPTTHVRLRDADYDQDLIAYGPHPFIGVSFPWIPGAPAQGSNLILQIQRTPLLISPSSITVKVGGVMAGFYEISRREERMTLTIPLAPLASSLKEQLQSDRLNVTVEGAFRLFDDKCKDIQSTELWLGLSNESAVEIASGNENAWLNNFLARSFPSLLVVTEQQDAAMTEAALTVVSAAKSVAPFLDVACTSAPAVNPTGSTVVLGNFEEDMQLSGSTLYLSLKGAKTFGDRVSSLLATAKAKVQSWKRSKWSVSNQPIPFSAFEYRSSTIRGQGELVTRVPFTLPQIGGYPKTLSAALHVVHTPIPDDDKGLIKVRLNGSLVSSERLSTNRATAPFTVTVTLPVDKLAQRNQLEVAFTYYPSQGNCAGVSPEMEATLFDDSSFLIGAPDIDKTLRLDSTLGNMHGRGALIMPKFTTTNLASVTEWAAMYGALHRETPDIHIMSSLPAGERFDYYVMCPGSDPLPQGVEPLVETGKTFAVRNPLTGEIPYQISVEEPLWVAQTFRYQGAPTLVLSCLSPDHAPAPGLTLTRLERLGGNVATGRDNHWQAMDIGRKLQAKTPDKPDLTYYWDRYKMAALLALAGVMLLFFYSVYTRLTGSK